MLLLTTILFVDRHFFVNPQSQMLLLWMEAGGWRNDVLRWNRKIKNERNGKHNKSDKQKKKVEHVENHNLVH